jgi:hypothetical protein
MSHPTADQYLIDKLRRHEVLTEDLDAAADRIERLREGLTLAREWLSGWGSAEPYVKRIDELLGSPADVPVTRDTIPCEEGFCPNDALPGQSACAQHSTRTSPHE